MDDINDEAEYLKDAASITLVVHGVGEHMFSEDEILAMAELGLEPNFRSTPDGKLHMDRVTLHQFPRPPSYTPDLDSSAPIPGRDPVSTCIHAANGKHIVIPVVWSGVRPRLADRIRFMGAGVTNPMRLVNQAIPVLLETSVDAMRCVGRANPGVVRVKVAMIAFVYLIIVSGFLLGMIAVTTILAFKWQDVMSSKNFWTAATLFITILILFRVSIIKLFRFWDFAGDVLSYIGHPGRREYIERTLGSIIEKGASLAPHAKLLVIGHSLGSVLVTHSLLGLRNLNDIENRVVVVILGSPLKLLSHLFPDSIFSPGKLVETFQKNKIVVDWVNLWRDADAIGRGLEPDPPQANFAETSLGDGPHTNYWNDPRFWDCVARIILWANGNKQQSLGDAIGADKALTDDEEIQVLAIKPGNYLSAMLAMILGGLLIYFTASSVLTSDYLLPKIMWGVYTVATMAAAISSLRVAQVGGNSLHRLAVERLWRPWRLLIGKIWGISALTLIIVIWLH
jgi:hypothetical protein